VSDSIAKVALASELALSWTLSTLTLALLSRLLAVLLFVTDLATVEALATECEQAYLFAIALAIRLNHRSPMLIHCDFVINDLHQCSQSKLFSC